MNKKLTLILDNAYIEKDGSVFASISIGDTHSMCFRENTSSLMIYGLLNTIFCLIAANHFNKTGPLAIIFGLKKDVS